MSEVNNIKYIVYKHTSPSNKVYIGITYLKPERRWRIDGSGYKSSKYFYNAIQKYGWDNFKHEILFDGLTKEEAEQKEIELIAYYDSTNHEKGYNISHGGNSVSKHNEETKRKISESRRGKYIGENSSFYGRHHSDKTRLILSQIAKERLSEPENHPFYGKRHSDATKKKLSEINTGKHITEETRKKISIANAGEKNNMFGKTHSDEVKELLSQLKKKPVWQYSLSGDFLKEWDSAMDAELSLGISGHGISDCCNNVDKTCYGYIWRFKGDDLDLNMIDWYNQGHNKAVVQYSKNGEYIRKFKSVQDASIETGADKSAIVACCKGKEKTAKKLIWRYADEPLTQEHLEWCNSYNVNPKSKLLKAVCQYTTDGVLVKIFNSMSEASKETGISVSSISQCCRDIIKTAKGYVWKYADKISDEGKAC